jgi:hypothetical protein
MSGEGAGGESDENARYQMVPEEGRHTYILHCRVPQFTSGQLPSPVKWTLGSTSLYTPQRPRRERPAEAVGTVSSFEQIAFHDALLFGGVGTWTLDSGLRVWGRESGVAGMLCMIQAGVKVEAGLNRAGCGKGYPHH